jgi:glutamyl-tRNA synthetase
MTTPRLRFAPSPTGMMHLGNARTALFNWLYARHADGELLLRIEDTDDSRNHPDWIDLIYRSLEWLGLGWDQEPQFQSTRFEAHRATGEDLYTRSLAYYCDCTREDLDARKAARGDKTPGYDGFCRERGLPPGPGRLLRFRVPGDDAIVRVDVIRGTTEIDPRTIEDFGIVRGNGTPLYVFANALDDIEDAITHVVRGEDHLTNVAKQILIRRALGAGEPVWAHLPMIVNAQRKKLSKRRDKLALSSYQEEGYLPEAMVNYLATLGWSPPSEDEIASLPEMVAAFTLDAVTSSPAMFDERKLDAFNGHYIRQLSTAEFVARARAFSASPALEPMAPEVQTRVTRLDQIEPMLAFFEGESVKIDEKALDKVRRTADVRDIVTETAEVLRSTPWDAEAIRAAIQSIGDRRDLALSKTQAPVRVAVTGQTVGPPLFESLVVLGRERTLARLQAFADQLGNDDGSDGGDDDGDGDDDG